MMYFYEYKVEYYNEVNAVTEVGITAGIDYAEALSRLQKYYGKDDIISIFLREWDEFECLPMTEDTLDEVKQNI
jgi:hypothetical protein